VRIVFVGLGDGREAADVAEQDRNDTFLTAEDKALREAIPALL
jgi:gamma-glutamylcysteine synthetase